MRISCLTPLLPLLLLTGPTLLTACGEGADETPDTTSTADAETEVQAGTNPFGAGCTTNAECTPGLFCMQSDFAPSGWCTVFCDKPGDHCAAPVLGDVGGLCIQMPKEFRGPIKPFCAVKCDNTAECTAIWKNWETCEKPSYKNVNLYNVLPTRTCSAPSSHGQKAVDPSACIWEAIYSEPKYAEAKQVCKAYCTYLKSCQHFDTKKRKFDCCTWHCFQKTTPKGKVDEDYMSDLKCYTHAFFNAYRGTGEVCTGPPKDCGGAADPMRD